VRPSRIARLQWLVACILFGASSREARADAGSVAAAQALFEQGRDLLRAGRASEACPKLEESQRLDAAMGTLLALALCHEAEGKLASAWVEFSGVLSLAVREGHAEREHLARKRVEALKPRLSTLELRVSDAVRAINGLVVRQNDVGLGHEAWNQPVPVDGGEYRIRVQAPGFVAWEGVAHVKPEGDSVVQVIEALKRVGAPQPPPAPASLAAAHKTEASKPVSTPDEGWTGLRWTGVGFAGAGLATLAVAGGVLLRAIDRDDPHLGNWATALGISSAALVTTGVALFWVGSSADAQAPKTKSSALDASIGPQAVQLTYRYSF
jgi:hypothetical protein